MESPEVDMFSLHLPQGEEGLIDLLMVDIQVLGGRPYVFCEHWREHYPQIKVVLTSSAQPQISDPERRWACFRGAADILPGIYLDKGLASLTSSLGKVLGLMDEGAVNQEALIAALKRNPGLGLRFKSDHPAPPQEPRKTLKEHPDCSAHLRYRGRTYNSKPAQETKADLKTNPGLVGIEPKYKSTNLAPKKSRETLKNPPDPKAPATFVRRYRGIDVHT